ncbi:MAG TPA: hypothetical protein VKP88_00740 [Candidatus Paceibacterota bacterium]|nr:hypothetical protein [Candidatus Paceibacterota bacterium]
MKYLLLLIPFYTLGQCVNYGSVFTYTECLEGEEQPYEATCNYGISWYTSIEFIVPVGSTSTVFMFEDSGLYYSHLSPSSSDLWILWSVSTDCEANDIVYTNGGWCSFNESVIIDDPDCCYNDPFIVELDLAPGVYYLHIPYNPLSGGSEFAGCYTVSVFSPGLLDLGVYELIRNNPILRQRFDAAGRMTTK